MVKNSMCTKIIKGLFCFCFVRFLFLFPFSTFDSFLLFFIRHGSQLRPMEQHAKWWEIALKTWFFLTMFSFSWRWFICPCWRCSFCIALPCFMSLYEKRKKQTIKKKKKKDRGMVWVAFGRVFVGCRDVCHHRYLNSYSLLLLYRYTAIAINVLNSCMSGPCPFPRELLVPLTLCALLGHYSTK